jgi:hypothetical protein
MTLAFGNTPHRMLRSNFLANTAVAIFRVNNFVDFWNLLYRSGSGQGMEGGVMIGKTAV